MFKTKVSIYHSKANLDKKILFGKIKMLVRGLYGNQEFHIPFCSMIYVALKFILPV